MGKSIDLTGQRFGRLVVIEKTIKPLHVKSHQGQYWLCQCDCGNQHIATCQNLRIGNVKSCGCIKEFHDLTGQQFDYLYVIRHLGKINGRHRYECKCRCGKTIISDTTNIKTKSCGCKAIIEDRDQVSINAIYSMYKSKAKNRNLDFKLTKEYFSKLIFSPCIYCGCKNSNTYKKGERTFLYNGIDRIDSSLGYVEENTVSCCYVCNYAKNNTGQQEFLKWIEKVYNYSIKESPKND